jgi:hypothetical protein
MSDHGEDPDRLLTEAEQWTEPWGGSEDGSRCDKCDASGRVMHECWSCSLAGAEESCPGCAGRVRWEDECPVCRGSGLVDGKPRHGVSTFPRVEGLYHYLLAKDTDLDGLLVELEGERAEDVDFDADQGALLVLPTRVISAAPIDRGAVHAVREGAAG